MIMTMQQTMAKTALETVQSSVGNFGNHEKKLKAYRNLCDGLPALLVQCGLTQTMAYLISAGKDEAKKDEAAKLAEDLTLHFNRLNLVPGAPDDKAALLKHLQKIDLAQYRAISSLAAEVAIWQKRMAKAFIVIK